jgi:hypothetical protein
MHACVAQQLAGMPLMDFVPFRSWIDLAAGLFRFDATLSSILRCSAFAP